MNVSPYELSIIAGCFTIVGALIAIIGAHRLAIHLESMKRRQTAISSFHAAFAPTLAFLYIARQSGSHDRPDIDNHIKGDLLSHGAAIARFRPFVAECDRRDYQKAWEEYRDDVAKDRYSVAVEPRIQNITVEEFFERKIHKLLQYAEIK